MSDNRYGRSRPMNVHVSPDSAAWQYICAQAGVPGNASPRALAPGFAPTRSHDLQFFGGKTIPNLRYLNFYVGSDDWDERDINNIDHALQAAMMDRRLNNVIVQYFPGGQITTQFLGSRRMGGGAPRSFSQANVEALVTQLHADGQLPGSNLGSTVFNFLLPRGTVLTLDEDDGSSDAAGGETKERSQGIESEGSNGRRGRSRPRRNPAHPEEEASSLLGLGGYHGSVHVGAGNSVTLYYAIGAFSEGNNGIVAFDQPWKNIVATFYHELCEARTDPDVEDAIKAGNDPNGARFLGWMSSQGEEIGDFPMEEAGRDLGLVMQEVELADGSGTVPIQLQYSNAVHGPEGPIERPHPGSSVRGSRGRQLAVGQGTSGGSSGNSCCPGKITMTTTVEIDFGVGSSVSVTTGDGRAKVDHKRTAVSSSAASDVASSIMSPNDSLWYAATGVVEASGIFGPNEDADQKVRSFLADRDDDDKADAIILFDLDMYVVGSGTALPTLIREMVEDIRVHLDQDGFDSTKFTADPNWNGNTTFQRIARRIFELYRH
jgi:hypothetical protein